jgi:hypothetical protein
MSKLQVSLVVASFGEADLLADYIVTSLCGKAYYVRDWPK